MTTELGLMGVLWLACMACAVAAIVVPFVWRRLLPLIAATGVAALLVSTMGFFGRSPFGSLPDVGYSWSNDSFEIAVRLRSLFSVPLLLAVIGLALAILHATRQSARGLAQSKT